jgi:hypothetical protein
MVRERQNRRALAGFMVCFVVSGVIVLAAGGLHELFTHDGLELAVTVSMLTALTLVLAGVMFVPYGIVVLGMAKLTEQRREEIDALGDENTVRSDPDGERKLHDYLTAISSMEARIGMLQRSDPYVPPEQRLPEGAPRPRLQVSRTTWAGISGFVTTGAILGMWGVRGELPDEVATPVRYAIGAAIGATFGLFFGMVYALVFGRTVQVVVENKDDAGRSGSETA